MSKFFDQNETVQLQKANKGGNRSLAIQNSTTLMADVTSIMFDSNNRSVGEITIQLLNERGERHNEVARPFNPHHFICPVVNERVYVIKDNLTAMYYYTGILPSRGELNYLPNTRRPVTMKGDDHSIISTGKYFKPQTDYTRTLDIYEGDLTIQSRYGSTIRLTGTNKEINTPWKKGQSADPTPMIMLRNGYLPMENLAWDPCSLWMTYDQEVKLPFKANFPSAIEGTKDTYTKSQVIFYCDRFAVGTRTDDIILNSKKTIYLCTQNWAHDVDVVLDTLKDLIVEVKGLNKEVTNMVMTNMKQTFMVPGMGMTGPSSQVPAFSVNRQKTTSISANLDSIERTLLELQQK